MSDRIRGQEQRIKALIDGKEQTGSWTKVENFIVTPDQDLVMSDFAGENESEGDLQHHGFRFSFTCHEMDSLLFAFLTDIVAREAAGRPRPNMQFLVLYKYRDLSIPSVVRSLTTGLVLKYAKHGGGERKQYVKNDFEGFAKKWRLQ